MYGIYSNGQFLANRTGWGPTFTMFRDDARRFRTEKSARDYIERNLSGFGADVVRL